MKSFEESNFHFEKKKKKVVIHLLSLFQPELQLSFKKLFNSFGSLFLRAEGSKGQTISKANYAVLNSPKK